MLTLRLTSGDLDPVALVPGKDAVLSLPLEHGVSLPHGVLIDDHLDLPAREGIDREARAALAAWRRQVDAVLTIGPICLSDVWESELLAEVFLPVTRTVRGVAAAVHAAATTRLACEGLDSELVAVLSAELPAVEVSATVVGPPPRYPGEEAVPPGIAARKPRWERLIRATLDAAGIPSIPRGEVLVFPYLSTTAVLERLTAPGAPRPVIYTGAVPSMALAGQAARRGGWLGLPGYLARRQARLHAEGRLTAAAALRWPQIESPSVERLLHTRALACLQARALETTAIVRSLRRVLAGRRVRALLLPFDHEPLPKTMIRVAQATGVPTVCVQHGYEPYNRFGTHTGTVADHAAVWSRWDRDALTEDKREHARVVGNPRARATAAQGRPERRRPLAVVLAEHNARNNSLLDRRVTARHLSAALNGLHASSHDWHVVVRPHPVDDIEQFERMVSALGFPGATVDGTTSATELLARADLLIGALSTMTLEAALAGVRVVMLDPQGVDWAPPFDRGGSVPRAIDAPTLSRAVDDAMRAAAAPGADELIEALGVGPHDPAGAIVAWLGEIAGNSGQLNAGRSRGAPDDARRGAAK